MNFTILKNSVSRWFSIDVGKRSDIELHIYSDASNAAYGAVAYIKSITSDKPVFVLSKAKSYSIKEKTLAPSRLELETAVTAVRLSSLKFSIFNLTESSFW